jgi:hypothetical protein
LFGNGVEVLVDPFSNFKDGRVVFGLFVRVNVIVNYPGAFAKKRGSACRSFDSQ